MCLLKIHLHNLFFIVFYETIVISIKHSSRLILNFTNIYLILLFASN